MSFNIRTYIDSYFNDNSTGIFTTWKEGEPAIRDLVLISTIGGSISTVLAIGAYKGLTNAINTLSENTFKNYSEVLPGTIDLGVGVVALLMSGTALYFTKRLMSSTLSQMKRKASLEGYSFSKIISKP